MSPEVVAAIITAAVSLIVSAFATYFALASQTPYTSHGKHASLNRLLCEIRVKRRILSPRGE